MGDGKQLSYLILIVHGKEEAYPSMKWIEFYQREWYRLITKSDCRLKTLKSKI
jgi:hypothetical protein